MTSNGEMPFDAIAADYDNQFSKSAIGMRLRTAVWQRLDAAFDAGQVVLELNCGTGEDAVHLATRGVRVVATDGSREMLRVAQRKVTEFDLDDFVRFALVDLREPNFEDLNEESFDGVVSNFGGLNCVSDLRPIAQGLSSFVKLGGRVVVCIMGPLVPWEWAWFIRRGQFGKAFRRLRPGGVHWRGLAIRYPTIAHAKRAFAPYFRFRGVTGVGVLLPPSYTEEWVKHHPRILELAARWDRRLGRFFPFTWLADHYVLELERVR